mmetsp:Transcript_4062/g.8701  ORF Transcript_4062/g.8701 Transcript_4062/m.8701 type:complete len:218 (+) Transcript_4062:788-1441(+)
MPFPRRLHAAACATATAAATSGRGEDATSDCGGGAREQEALFVFGGNVDKETQEEEANGLSSGGSGGGGGYDTASVLRFDPLLNAWSERRALPQGGCCAAATVAGRFVFVGIFGRGLVRYDALTDSYAAGSKSGSDGTKTKNAGGRDGSLSPLPLVDWHGFSMTSTGPFLFLVGGVSQGVWSPRTFCCDTRTGAFAELPPMVTPRRRTAAAIATVPS